MAPPLEQLFQPGTLPAQGPTPAHVTDWPVCTPMDTRVRRISVSPNGAQVLFTPMTRADGTPNDELAALPPASYLNIDDGLLSRILDLRGNFLYQGQNGVRYAPLCYDPNGTTVPGQPARYPLYVADIPALQRPAPTGGYVDVPFDFTPGEIALIARGLPRADGQGNLLVTTPDYATVTDNPRKLKIFADRGGVDRLRAALVDPNSPIAANRRQAMADAFHLPAVYDTREFQGSAQVQQREMAERMDRMDTKNTLLMGFMAYLTARQMGLTNRMDSFLSNAARAVFDLPGHIFRGQVREIGRQWSDIFRPRNPVTTELTDRLRTASIPLTEGGRSILEAFDRGEMTNVIYGGPSGGGKGYDTESAFAAAIQGRSGVEAFEGRNLRAYRISVGAIIERAGSWLNGGEKEFLQALKQIPDGSLVQLTEADQLAACGQGPGNEKLNLLPRLYNIMEQRPDLFFDLESTRWPVIEVAAPDLLRRTGFAEIRPPRPQLLRQILNTGVEMRRSGSKGKVLERRYNAYTFTPEALDAVTALGAFERGAPPSSHLMVMDEVMAEFARSRRGGGSTTIGQDDVVRFVARKTNSTEVRVSANLRALLEGGVENNPRIQSQIVDGFYRAYAHPKSGFVNPLNPNPNPAFVIQNGERIDLPAGSYASAREAVAPGAQPAPGAAAAPAAQPAPVRSGWEEVMTYRVNDQAIYDSLARVDRSLADFYRAQISTSVSPVTTMSDLIARISVVNPNALAGALQVATQEGRPISQMPERMMFELIAQTAERQRAWTDSDVTRRARYVTTFETEVRSRSGVERTDPTRPEDTDPTRRRRRRGAAEGEADPTPVRRGRP